MSKLIPSLVLVAVLLLVGGVTYLGLWDKPAPTQQIQRVIPNDRFG